MIIKKQTSALLAISMVLFLVSASSAQGDYSSFLREKNSAGIRIDHAVFAAEDTSLRRLEVYYQVYNSSLIFEEVDGLFQASYDIKVKLMDNRGRSIKDETREKTIKVADKQESISGSSFRTSQINFILEPGKYEVRFVFDDKNSRKDKDWVKEFRAKVEDVKKGHPKLSDILFAQAAGQLKGESNLFTKGDKTIIPSVSHYYGGGEDKDNKILFYLEIYPGSKGQHKVTVQTLIRKKKGKMVYRDTLTSKLERPFVRQLREISVAGFEPGEYEIEIELKGVRGKKFDKQKDKFLIRWNEESLIQFNYDVLVNQIALIASSKEISALKEAKTLEDKKNALSEFWKSKDPYPETPRNELRVKFYSRVRLANANYGYLRYQGWETDRGRILIRYGVPDQIEDYPFALETYPSQIWHYYRKGRYRKFLFIDNNHDGDYRLQYPYDGIGLDPDF